LFKEWSSYGESSQSDYAAVYHDFLNVFNLLENNNIIDELIESEDVNNCIIAFEILAKSKYKLKNDKRGNRI